MLLGHLTSILEDRAEFMTALPTASYQEPDRPRDLLVCFEYVKVGALQEHAQWLEVAAHVHVAVQSQNEAVRRYSMQQAIGCTNCFGVGLSYVIWCADTGLLLVFR